MKDMMISAGAAYPIRNLLTSPNTHTGRPTQNRRFAEAAAEYQASNASPEPVRVCEKLRQCIWVYNGLFHLLDSRREQTGGRAVFKFRLQIAAEQLDNVNTPESSDVQTGAHAPHSKHSQTRSLEA